MGKDKQKTIRHIVKQPCDKENIYAAINISAMEKAAQNLEAGAFKLWCYFAKNNEKYKYWELSNKDVEKSFGMKRDQYNGAMAKLIDKGYLVPIESDNEVANLWDFIEMPEAVTEAKNTLVGNSYKPLMENPTSPCRKIPQALKEKTTTNITYNTEIIQNNTRAAQSDESAANSERERELKAKVGSDGSYNNSWFDNSISHFWAMSAEEKINSIAATYSEFSADDAAFIVNSILI